MSEDRAPHFLRVVRSLAKVRTAAPVAAMFTTVIAGVHCAAADGITCSEECGVGAAASSTSSSATTGSTTGGTSSGVEVGLAAMDGGYDGAPVGDMVMPDAGADEDGGDGGA